jgi:hypothetical protein
MSGRSTLSGSAAERTALGGDLHLTMTMPERDGSVEIGLEHGNKTLATARLSPGVPCQQFTFDGDTLKIDMTVCADTGLGAITATGSVQILDDGTWQTILSLDDDRLLSFAPGAGAVGGNPVPDPPVVTSQKYGNSMSSSGSTVTRFFVDDDYRVISNAGAMAKAALFEGYPDFVLNVVACVGANRPDGFGVYPDPTSSWFDVFFGYYQIDAPRDAWDRPFGYVSANGVASKVAFEDIARLGKSDWNYFSAWMYGVPEEAILPYNGIDMTKIASAQASQPLHIGSSLWHDAAVGNVDVVSAFKSSAPGAAGYSFNSVLTPLWQESFGRPDPQPQPPKSFIGAILEGRFFMAYYEDSEGYHTVMFGGTGAYKRDETFVDLQRQAGAAVIARSYPGLGFSTG